MDFVYDKPGAIVPGIVRIVANNPGPFTFKGTNTYIIGNQSLAVIDPGPDDPDHIAAILDYANGREISHILITHTHRDHIDGLPALAEATGAQVVGFGRKGMKTDPRVASETGRRFIDLEFAPEIPVVDGDRITGADWALDCIHTPGHAPDHICYALSGRKIVFSGDHVMGWNTTVVAPPEGHMGDYCRSLDKLAALDCDLFLPGHGGRIAEPRKVTKAYLVHRRMREQAIMDAIRKGHDSIDAVVALVYQNLDERLVTAAKLSVQAHVEDLMDRDILVTTQPVAFDTPLAPVRTQAP
jgi:glyoxylase-like metal-dependent hydrolase (beta-lactamase superfamily II)